MRLLLVFILTFTILAGAAERAPMEMLTFLELRDDMRVLELMPGGSG